MLREGGETYKIMRNKSLIKHGKENQLFIQLKRTGVCWFSQFHQAMCLGSMDDWLAGKIKRCFWRESEKSCLRHFSAFECLPAFCRWEDELWGSGNQGKIDLLEIRHRHVRCNLGKVQTIVIVSLTIFHLHLFSAALSWRFTPTGDGNGANP